MPEGGGPVLLLHSVHVGHVVLLIGFGPGPAPSCSRRVAGARRSLSYRDDLCASPTEDDSACADRSSSAGMSRPPPARCPGGRSSTADRGEGERQMVDERGARRGVLPIPDRQHLGLLTYDAKDPDTSFPPIEPLLPPEGAPNVLIVLLDDVGFGAGSAFGGPARMPTAERLQRGGLTYNRFHTTALCAPTRAALLSGRNHHSVGHGHDHRDRDLGARLERAAAEHQGRAADDVEAQRLLDRPVRQVPRGAAVADLAGRPVRRLAHRRRWVRALLRVHRRREQPVLPGALRGHDAGRAGEDARRRATTSPRTWPTAPSTGSAPRRRWRRTSRSSCTSRPAPRTRRTTCRWSGRTSTPASSPTAGTRSGSRSSRGRSSSASCPRTPS